MKTWTVTIARVIYETCNVDVAAEHERAAIAAAKRLYETTDMQWHADVADVQFIIYDDTTQT